MLKGYTEYLRTYVPQKRISEEKLLGTVDLMHTYVGRLEGYAVSMSEMQKLEEVKPRPQSIAFADLCKRLQGAADMLRGVHRLRFDCTGEICVDANLITQVLENLVSNASRYAKAEISADVRLDGNTLSISISDDGPGFSDKILRRGIAPYNRVQGEDPQTEHYGLGLYICSVLCVRHGGVLTLPEEAGSSRLTTTFALL